MKCNHKTESFEDFPVTFQNLAMQTYPTPADLVASLNAVANDEDM